MSFSIFELSRLVVLSKRVRQVKDSSSGSKTFLEPAELALS